MSWSSLGLVLVVDKLPREKVKLASLSRTCERAPSLQLPGSHCAGAGWGLDLGECESVRGQFLAAKQAASRPLTVASAPALKSLQSAKLEILVDPALEEAATSSTLPCNPTTEQPRNSKDGLVCQWEDERREKDPNTHDSAITGLTILN